MTNDNPFERLAPPELPRSVGPRPRVSATGVGTSGTNVPDAQPFQPSHEQPTTGVASNTGANRPPPGASVVSGRRLVRSADFLSSRSPIVGEALNLNRLKAATRFHLELKEAKIQLELVSKIVQARVLPRKLLGIVTQPNGAAAKRVQVETEIVREGSNPRRYFAITNDDGQFTLALPIGVPLPSDGLALTIRGANENVTFTLLSGRIADNGFVGSIVLATALDPLPPSIVGSLVSLLPKPGMQSLLDSAEPLAAQPELRMGEDGTHTIVYKTDASVERYPYSVFLRLVEPRTSIVSPVIKLFPRRGKRMLRRTPSSPPPSTKWPVPAASSAPNRATGASEVASSLSAPGVVAALPAAPRQAGWRATATSLPVAPGTCILRSSVKLRRGGALNAPACASRAALRLRTLLPKSSQTTTTPAPLRCSTGMCYASSMSPRRSMASRSSV